ncbi:organic hydroperoxide resistance protein [Actinophytocola gossypii]|uniref:Organic hydroperoxide resistance protein n=1 Tax=Actinophytocola gossypii TaxID=2812003 RepID=A0ABT2J899_9PSEU|nr:organic hydroperoxide resistance protein [Actinophytocola gossypii]MCT2583705.1 organic hydroperoxide resistance protein [Actinophytocola gossypii]
MSTLYTAKATSTGSGRAGHVESDDGVLSADLSMPEGLGGAGGSGTNPEQLFAAGYAACFHSALHGVARREKLRLADSSVTAEVGIGKVGEGFGLSVELVVSIPEVDQDTARKLADAAHQVCPYSNATRGNIDVTVRVA